MYLWHGTYEDTKDDILKTGVLKNTMSTGTTNEIDDIFVKYLGFNPRENCIYFSGDTESADGYDYAFRVHTRAINTDLLYVGDFSLTDEMFGTIEKNELKVICEKYANTLTTFSDYFKNSHGFMNRNVWELEFLYFGEIEVDEDDLD